MGPPQARPRALLDPAELSSGRPVDVVRRCILRAMERSRDRRLLGTSRLALALSLATGLACNGDDSSCAGLDGEVSPRCSVALTEEAASDTATASDPTEGSTGESESDTAVDTESSSSTGVVNLCEVNAVGEWNACKKGPLTDNSKCNWMDTGMTAGEITCLQPSSGGGNICSIEQCEDECDCFAPPATGTAPVICAPVLKDNVKGCVLDCGSGGTCPDEMIYISGYCYLPNETL